MSSVIYNGGQDIIGDVNQNGFFKISNFFDLNVVAKARDEMAALLDRDIAVRENQGETRAVHREQGLFHTALTDKMHTRFFPSWESQTFSTMVGDMLTHPTIENFRHEVLGKHIRLRIDLIRRASGMNDVVDDFQLPHAWHRDTPGEFTFGIFFDDLNEPCSGGTGVIPGTHKEKLDPRWDLLLAPDGMPLRQQFLDGLRQVPEGVYENAPKNQMARERVINATHEISGKAGDIYFFLNDTWHGRFGNSSGKQHMIARVGGFATEFDFKDDIPLPDETGCLDDRLFAFYSDKSPKNTEASLLQELLGRGSIDPIFTEAQKEKCDLLNGLNVESVKAETRKANQAAALALRQAAREKAQAEALAAKQALRKAAQEKALADRKAARLKAQNEAKVAKNGLLD